MNQASWNAALESIAGESPEFLAKYEALAAAPSITAALTAKTRELIGIALRASVTDQDAEALQAHMAQALRHGATGDEIREVLQLVSVLGIHGFNFGVRILQQEWQGPEWAQRLKRPLDATQETAKQNFIDKRGYWSDTWEQVLKLSPDFFEAYSDFSSHPWENGCLEPKVREFIYIAIDISATHLYDPGTRNHVRNAMQLGASLTEILEVLMISSTIGITAATLGYPLLERELQKAASAASTSQTAQA